MPSRNLVPGPVAEGSAFWDESLIRSYVPAFDGLRAFAALGVVLFHLERHLTWAPSMHAIAQRGWFGVDIFFTLSGFLITWLLLKERRRTSSISVGSFYLRRMLRLWPAYIVCVALTTAVLMVAGSTTQRVAALGALPFLLTYTVNLSSTFGRAFPLTVHAWSLALEEQYYALYPWLVRSVADPVPRLLRVLAVSTIVLAAARAIGTFWWPFSWPIAGHLTAVTQWLFPFRLDSILVGGVAVCGLFNPGLLAGIRRVVGEGAGTACWLCYVGLWWVFGRSYHNLAAPLLYVGSACIISLTFLGRPAWVVRILEHPVLLFIGRISYGIYLFHVLAINVVEAAMQRFVPVPSSRSEGGVVLLSLLLSVVAGAISHFAIERPFLRMKHDAVKPPFREAV